MPEAYLVIIGVGEQPAEHITIEARAWLVNAGRVFHFLTDEAAQRWLHQLHPPAQSMQQEADPLTPITIALQAGMSVCLVLPGHPALHPLAHQALQQARTAGYRAWMSPAVSAEDCLFADLLVDPGRAGGQSFDTTHFLLQRCRFDASSMLMLWHLHQIGQLEAALGLRVLRDYLTDYYPAGHLVILYEPPTAGNQSQMQGFELQSLPTAQVTPQTLLYVPGRPGAKADKAMRRRLGMEPAHGGTP